MTVFSLFPHCTDEKHETDHGSTFYNFIQYNGGNWFQKLSPKAFCYSIYWGTGKATKGPVWLDKRHGGKNQMVKVREVRGNYNQRVC